MAFMQPACFRVLDTLDIIGQTYFRLKHTELWATWKVCEVLLEGHQLYRKWRSIPRFVNLLQSPDDSKRVIGVQELEFLSSKNTGTKAFSQRALELGALPGILACLNQDAPATAVCAALCILSDVFSHPLCTPAFTPRILSLIFSLLNNDDLYLRLRSALLLALLSSEERLSEQLKILMYNEGAGFMTKMSDLICRPLPNRYQVAIETPNIDLNPSTLRHLRNCENQVRKSGIALLFLVAKEQDLMRTIDRGRILPVLVKSIRGGDTGLRSASLRCMKVILRDEGILMKTLSRSICLYWKEVVPKVRDLEVLQAIEDLGVYPEIIDKLIHEVFFLHRMPNLLTVKNIMIRKMAFRALYPFTLINRHRWKVVSTGLLHLLFKGLFDGRKSIYVSALICLSQLCASQEVCLAVQAEIEQQQTLLPARVGEYLIYLVLHFPEEEIGQGALRLLGDAIPKIAALPSRVLPRLRDILQTGDSPHKTGTAKLVSRIAQVERFRDQLQKSGIVNNLISLANISEGKNKASILEALALFSVKKQVAQRLVNLKGLTESLWNAQESDDQELAVAALELLRVLSCSLGTLPGGLDRTIDINCP
eukprot:g2543.t1